MFTWYRGHFHPGASSLRFPLMALYSFTWYQHKMSCRREFTPVLFFFFSSPRFLFRSEIFIPVRKFIPVSCKQGTTVRFISIKVLSILRHYKTRTPTNTALCKHGATFHLAPEWKSHRYHVNTPLFCDALGSLPSTNKTMKKNKLKSVDLISMISYNFVSEKGSQCLKN